MDVGLRVRKSKFILCSLGLCTKGRRWSGNWMKANVDVLSTDEQNWNQIPNCRMNLQYGDLQRNNLKM